MSRSRCVAAYASRQSRTAGKAFSADARIICALLFILTNDGLLPTGTSVELRLGFSGKVLWESNYR